MTASISDVRSVVSQTFPQSLNELKDLVRIPSVSWSSFDPEQVARSAQAVSDLLAGTNLFEDVFILRSQKSDSKELGQPAVVARRNPAPGMPTVLLYAHHDVQPPGDLAMWESSPFEPEERSGRLHGRGAADDKAGIMAHVTSLRLLPELVENVELGIVVFIEGEEEFGSPSFENFLSDHHELLASDVIVVADSGNWNTETPALTTTLRGNATFKLTVRTLDHALHSGMFGGAVPDAFMAFAGLVSSFYTQSGSVAVEGLHRSSVPTPEYSDEQMREESGVLDSVSLIGDGHVLGRLWSQPSISVTGIDIPDVANASNTLLPSVSARISVRVAPGQSASEAFSAIQQHITEHIPFGAIVEFEDVNLGEAFSTDTSGWAAQSISHALTQSWDQEVVNMGVGGSIPFISSFVSAFPNAQVLVTGVEDPDSRAHSPNESLHIESFEKAIVAELLFLVDLNSKKP
ncbi:dipeptidase [Aurantimicrobium minutum]|uniref:dipeptidase n=1 Tax=Aurantimicrobium minutum TaxID=708131 RepID=UPI0024759573|nr:dipeptidase [Aurantimicrobium minutum]MDH6207730.1 acetylornithine deacetylase/succinyl-diaminopimelate desuccinylase-like protein [Aurantimicrobium minutum]MDH6255537.1 acetylornithine deacetylase/succinyl-diaminopimelate desuccinylase-like protein [Aurantimicrobium minutum]